MTMHVLESVPGAVATGSRATTKIEPGRGYPVATAPVLPSSIIEAATNKTIDLSSGIV